MRTFTNVFYRNLDAYANKTRLIINQGATSSGKTYSILQLLYQIAIRSKKERDISICSRTMPHLKGGAIKDFNKILVGEDVNVDKILHKTDHIYKLGKCNTNYFGADSLDFVHGQRRNILFVNEIQFIKYEVFWQMYIRTDELVIVDYNPINEFWIHTEVIPKIPHVFIKSTYLDNPYLEQSIIDSIEARKDDENWFRVYGLGEVGRLEGAIITDWERGEWDESLPYGYGLDFGFHPDPDALVRVAIDHRKNIIYAEEKSYERNQGTETLITELLRHVNQNDLIVAESAEPRLIHDLTPYFRNIMPVTKGKGSVLAGLRLMNNYKLVVCGESYNLEKELMNHVWVDEKAGVPSKGWNHLISGIRYYLTETTQERRIYKPENKRVHYF